MKAELTAGIVPPAFQPLTLTITIETERELYALRSLYGAITSVSSAAYTKSVGYKEKFSVEDVQNALRYLDDLDVKAEELSLKS